MTFLDFYTEISDRTHMPVSNTIFLAKIKRWLNLARMFLVSLNPDGWYFMATTGTVTLVAGTVEYSLASDFDKINPGEVRFTASLKRISHAPDKDLELLISDTEFITPATPKVFRLVGYQKIRLLPAPSAAVVTAEGTVTYEYFKNSLADMSADGNTSSLPQKFEPALLDLAEVYAQQYLRKLDRAQMAAERALSSLSVLAPNNTSILRLSAKQVVGALKTDAAQQATTVDRT